MLRGSCASTSEFPSRPAARFFWWTSRFFCLSAKKNKTNSGIKKILSKKVYKADNQRVVIQHHRHTPTIDPVYTRLAARALHHIVALHSIARNPDTFHRQTADTTTSIISRPANRYSIPAALHSPGHNIPPQSTSPTATIHLPDHHNIEKLPPPSPLTIVTGSWGVLCVVLW